MAANSQHRCVFVGNIPYDATEEQLVQICEEVGPVVSFRLVIDRETGKPKGYGFCEYKDEETALSARRNLQGYEINGRQLRVDFAENDKGSDRNREQGRGGPGFTASNDAQRPLGGPAILADPAFNQPIGIPLAATAASVLVGALGGVQADSISAKQNGLQSQSSFGNDPLTHSLANMSRKQLYDVLSEMKVMSTQNKELARQLLLVSPQLTKALFQAQIMLGMVTPQMLQNPNLRQSSSLLLQPLAQDTIHDPKPTVLPPHPGPKSFTQNKTQFGLIPRVTEGQVSSVPHSFNNNHPPAFPFQQVQMQPRFQHPQQAHNPLLPPTTMPVLSVASTVPSLRPFTGLSTRPQTSMLENSVASKENMQTLQSQNPRPVHNNTQSALPNAASHQHSLLPRPPLSQPTFQLGSSSSTSFLGVPETANKLTQKSAQGTDGTIWPPSSNAYSNLPFGLSEQTGLVSGPFEPTYHPSKLPRLENGRGALHTTSQNITSISGSTSSPILGSSSLPGDRNFTNEAEQHSDKQFSEMQLAPEVQSALLKQVMSLTSEQLSSLPPEQQQQVLQLQQMLR